MMRSGLPGDYRARKRGLSHIKRAICCEIDNALQLGADMRLVSTWARVADACFIRDVSDRMIVGWRCASHLPNEMVLDAIDMTRSGRGTQHENLRCHSDSGSQFTSIRNQERLAEIGTTPSGPGRGGRSRTSSSRPSAGSASTTRSTSTPSSPTFHSSSSRTRLMVDKPTANRRPKLNSGSLHQILSTSHGERQAWSRHRDPYDKLTISYRGAVVLRTIIIVWLRTIRNMR